jgi:DNA helicase HerA-like ATPase
MQLFRVEPPIGKAQKRITIGGPGRAASAILGRLAELGPPKEIAFDLENQHVVAVVGKRGSGKTHTLGVFVEGLSACASGNAKGISSGASKHAVVVFDTLNLFQWIATPLQDATGPTVATQLELLRRWKLEPCSIPAQFLHLSGSTPAISASKAFSIRAEDMDAQDWARLLRVDLMGEPIGHLLGEAHRRAVAANSFGVSSINDLISALRTDRGIQRDYSPETIRALRQRLNAYDSSALFDSSVEDWSRTIRPGTVSVFLLGRTPEDLRSVLVFLVIRRILEQRAEASERAKHALLSGVPADTAAMPPTWLVIDEAQNILPSSNATAANEILVRYVREGRNFGLSLAISTQQPTAIDAKVMAQVDTLISHTLTVRTDLNYVLANLKSAEPDRVRLGPRELTLSDSVRLLEPGQCMLSATDSPRCVYVEIRPRLTLHGGFEV